MGKILVTGGTGFIGSHTCVALTNAGYPVVVMDNLSNSKVEAIARIEMITGKHVRFYRTDMRDEADLEQIFEDNKIDAVIHFAGMKAVGESVEKPLEYYENNVSGTLTLLRVMRKYGCRTMIFSSSATVYGSQNPVPYREEMPTSATNPYGYTKVMIEQILRDLHVSDAEWNIALLRYFNPIGAHKSGLLGESPNDIPNNLMPYIVKVAAGELPLLHVFGNDYDTPIGRLECLSVFGDDYDTPDGTGVRDYIHVVDLAKGHVNAVDKLLREHIGIDAYNLGTGNGYSVLEVVHTFARVNALEVPYQIDARRPGDIATCYASTEKAQRELGWKAEKGLEEMCADAWHFACKAKQQ